VAKLRLLQPIAPEHRIEQLSFHINRNSFWQR